MTAQPSPSSTTTPTQSLAAAAGSALVSTIGARLRAARKASGVSLAKLHSVHGYSPSTISRWELRSLPTLRHLMNLCRIYNIQPSNILNDI